MGHFSDLAIDTRTWQEAADDATRDRLDTLALEIDPLPFQPPNLLDRLLHCRAQARAAHGPIARREWIEHAENLIDQLCDPRETCDCGMTFDALTDLCLDCLEREQQLIADRARIAELCAQRDDDIPF